MPPLPPAVELPEDAQGAAVVALVGSLDVWAVASVRRELIARLSSARLTSLDIDASGIERGDMSGMAILYGLMQGRFGRGMRARLVGLRPELQKLLSAFPSEATLKAVEAAPPRASLPEEIGTATLHLARDVREQVAFVGDVILSRRRGLRGRDGCAGPRSASLREGRCQRPADRARSSAS